MDNYLQHHGVQGQKWGVRRYQNADGTLTAAGAARYGVHRVGEVLNRQAESARNLMRYGLKRGHAKNVAGRIDRYVMTDARKANMSERQRISANKAKKYWDARAAGKTPEEHRNIIKRMEDSYRSYSFDERAIRSVINSARNATTYASNMERMYGTKIGAGRTAANTVISSAQNLAFAEIVDKVFGHF